MAGRPPPAPPKGQKGQQPRLPGNNAAVFPTPQQGSQPRPSGPAQGSQQRPPAPPQRSQQRAPAPAQRSQQRPPAPAQRSQQRPPVPAQRPQQLPPPAASQITQQQPSNVNIANPSQTLTAKSAASAAVPPEEEPPPPSKPASKSISVPNSMMFPQTTPTSAKPSTEQQQPSQGSLSASPSAPAAAAPPPSSSDNRAFLQVSQQPSPVTNNPTPRRRSAKDGMTVTFPYITTTPSNASEPARSTTSPTKSKVDQEPSMEGAGLIAILVTPAPATDKDEFRSIRFNYDNMPPRASQRQPYPESENEYLNKAPTAQSSERVPLGKPGYMGWVWECPPAGVREKYKGGSSSSSRKKIRIGLFDNVDTGENKPNIFCLALFGLMSFLSGMTVTMQAPFYTFEAESKGGTPSEYGSLFGIFELLLLLASPIFGNYMTKIGPKTLFCLGTSVGSCAIVCFGLLDKILDHTWFTTLSFIIRIFEGLGCASMISAIFAITAYQYPESVPKNFAFLETCFGVGLILGPAFGGAFYGLGGFRLSFFFVGVSLLITTIVYLSSFTIPTIGDEARMKSEYSTWTILKIPAVALAAASIASTAMSWAFVTSVLEPHIRRYHFTHLVTGLVFLVNGVTYGLSGPLCGYICKHTSQPAYIGVFGHALVFVAFLLIEPAGFFPFDTMLGVTLIGLFIQGLGISCCLVSGFVVAFRSCLQHGHPNNLTTYGVASGLWASMGSLGGWLGYTSSGILYSAVGLRRASYLILAIILIVGISNLVYTCISSRTPGGSKPSAKNSESQPLLKPTAQYTGR